MHDVTNLHSLLFHYMQGVSFIFDFNTSFFTQPVQMIFSSTLQHYFHGVSDLIAKVSMFQHYTKLHFTFSIIFTICVRN
jgi:hypothetical protein